MSTPPKKSVVEQLLSIAATPDASIKRKIAREKFGDDYKLLLIENVLNHFKNLKDIEVADSDRAYTAEIERRDGKNMYFSPSDGWVAVLDEDIALYQINFEWLLRVIMNALNIAGRHKPKEILKEKIWALGQHRIERQLINIIVARNIGNDTVFEELKNYLNNHHTVRNTALVIALDKNIPVHMLLPNQNELIRIDEAIKWDKDNFELNTAFLAGKMGGTISKPGFSNGYRTLISNGKTYEFTLKQSEALEAMHLAGKPIHQTEILAQTTSQQGNKLRELFKGKGGKIHDAWNVIIKSDRKGNYWLEC